MSKKDRRPQPQKKETEEVQNQSELGVIIWPSFDVCWASCVRNGNDLLKQSAIAHLKAIGAWDDQSLWVFGLQHFGIKTEE